MAQYIMPMKFLSRYNFAQCEEITLCNISRSVNYILVLLYPSAAANK